MSKTIDGIISDTNETVVPVSVKARVTVPSRPTSYLPEIPFEPAATADDIFSADTRESNALFYDKITVGELAKEHAGRLKRRSQTVVESAQQSIAPSLTLSNAAGVEAAAESFTQSALFNTVDEDDDELFAVPPTEPTTVDALKARAAHGYAVAKDALSGFAESVRDLTILDSMKRNTLAAKKSLVTTYRHGEVSIFGNTVSRIIILVQTLAIVALLIALYR